MITLVAVVGVLSIGCAPQEQSTAVQTTNATSGSERNLRQVSHPKTQLPIQQSTTRVSQRSKAPWKPSAPAREWKYIVLHHTATDMGSVESIHRTHLQRRDSEGKPWQGIGYHFVIGNGNGMPDGAIESTFRWRGQMHGAHAGSEDYNEHGIGIVLIGNFDQHQPSTAQLKSAQRLIATLRSNYNIDRKHIVGHGDIKQTACPGRFLSVARVTHGASRTQVGQSSQSSATDVALAGLNEE